MDRSNQYKQVCIKLIRCKGALTIINRDDEFYREVISLVPYDDLVSMGCKQFNNRGAIIGSLDDEDYNKFMGDLVSNNYIKDVQIWVNYMVDLLNYIDNNGVRLNEVGDDVCLFIKDHLDSMFNRIRKKFVNYKSDLAYFGGSDNRPYFPVSTSLKVLEIARLYGRVFEGNNLECYRYYRSEIEGILNLLSVQAKDLILRYHETYSYVIMEELLRYREETSNRDKLRISQNKLAIVDAHVNKYKGES